MQLTLVVPDCYSDCYFTESQFDHLEDDPQEDKFERPVQACGEQVTDRTIKRRANHSASSP